MLAEAAIDVPCTRTVAPTRGSPSSSVITPVHLFWACSCACGEGVSALAVVALAAPAESRPASKTIDHVFTLKVLDILADFVD